MQTIPINLKNMKTTNHKDIPVAVAAAAYQIIVITDKCIIPIGRATIPSDDQYLHPAAVAVNQIVLLTLEILIDILQIPIMMPPTIGIIRPYTPADGQPQPLLNQLITIFMSQIPEERQNII